MYLIDTNIISEARKGPQANKGVQLFFQKAAKENADLYLSAITIGELRRGIEILYYRGDVTKAQLLERWFSKILIDFEGKILSFTSEMSQVWGRLRVPKSELEIDKQIAATALIHDLTLVTRNGKDFANAGIRILNPFE